MSERRRARAPEVVASFAWEGIRKPDPEIYLRAAERLLVEPKACVFLDDSAVNCDGAATVGMRTVVVGADIHAAIAELDALLAP